MLAVSLSKIEQGALSQRKESLTNNVGTVSEKDTGTLAHALKKGIVNAEVENLRWRTYSVLAAAKTYTTKIVGYDEKGRPITAMVKYNPENALSDIKVDSFDSYPLQMVIDNGVITTSVLEELDKLDDDRILFTDTPIINHDNKGEVKSATHGEFKSNSHVDKHERPIKVEREYLPNFQIEDFATKLNIRGINETEKLLEFYLSKYPDENNRTTRLLISEIKKAMINPRASSMLDIKEIGFITYKTLGVDDFLEYQYKITSFDKIIEFNSYYVIKFKADVIVNGKSIIEEYRVESLDKKYEQKTKK